MNEAGIILSTVWGVTVFVILMLQAFSHDIWKDVDYDPGPWCEQERTSSFLREPINSFTDVSFLAVGLVQIYYGIQDTYRRHSPLQVTIDDNLILTFPFLSFVSGLANIVHAIGTFTNHACRCHSGHRWDVMGMCATTLFLALYNASRFLVLTVPLKRRLWARYFPSVFSVAFLLGCMLLYLLSDLYYNDPRCEAREAIMLGSLIFVNFVGCICFNHFSSKTTSDSNFFYFAILMVMMGFTFHQMDVRKILCNPTGMIQLHGLWHLFTAAALHFFYLYLRSQQTLEHYKRVL